MALFHNKSESENLKSELKRLKKENELKDKEIKILKNNNKAKDQVIEDLDRYNYKEKYNIAASHLKCLTEIDKEKNVEIEELKKK